MLNFTYNPKPLFTKPIGQVMFGGDLCWTCLFVILTVLFMFYLDYSPRILGNYQQIDGHNVIIISVFYVALSNNQKTK
jgi:hypothetical protein